MSLQTYNILGEILYTYHVVMRIEKQVRKRKLEEREYLDQLVRLYPGFPQGRIISSESPDFIVYTKGRRKTGIELTRLTRNDGSPYRSDNHFKPDFSVESLQELIRCKEAKLELYRKKSVQGVWLLILVNGFSHSSAFNIRNHLEKWKPETSFNAVLVLDLILQKVYEIKPPVQPA